MKKLILIILLAFVHTLTFGQIYVNSGTEESIIITPDGIGGKYPIPTNKNNVSLGSGALKNITNQSENVAIGNKTLYTSTSERNTALGSLALYGSTTGGLNTSFGNHTMEHNTIGHSNVAFGSYALNNNVGLNGNVAVGANALFQQGLYTNNGGSNTAVGYSALYSTINPGKYNVGVGAYALTNNTTGITNTGVGVLAAAGNTSGQNNVAIGNSAGYSSQKSINNTIIGTEALYNNNLLGANIAIGYQAGYTSSYNHMLFISNSNTTNPLLGGIGYMGKVGINRNLNIIGENYFLTRTEALQVEGAAFKTTAGGNWVIPSDRRLKKNITPLNSEEILAKVLQMKGVTYEMKDTTQQGIQYGFIAQELQEVFPTKVEKNADGYLSADYGSYTAIEIEAIKALHQKIAELEKYNDTLRERIEKLRTTKDLISAKLSGVESKK